MDKKILISIKVIISIVVVAAIVILCYLMFQNQYKNPIKDYYKGIETANINTYAKAFPEFMGVDKTMSENTLKQDLEELEEEYGDNIKISFKIISKEKMDKDTLKILEKVIKSRYNKSIKLSEGYTLKVETTLKGDKGSNIDTHKMYVYKIDGKWKYIPFSPEIVKKMVESTSTQE